MGASDDELKEIAVRTISPYVQQISHMYTLVELMKARLGIEGVRNETEKTPKGSKILHPSHKIHVHASGRKGLVARNIGSPKCVRNHAALERNCVNVGLEIQCCSPVFLALRQK